MKWCLCSPASELLHTLSFSWLISRDLFVPVDWKVILHTFHLPDLFDSVPDKHGRRGLRLATLHHWLGDSTVLRWERTQLQPLSVTSIWWEAIFTLAHVRKMKTKNPKGNMEICTPSSWFFKVHFERWTCFESHCRRETVFTNPSSIFLDRHNTTQSNHFMLSFPSLKNWV